MRSFDGRCVNTTTFLILKSTDPVPQTTYKPTRDTKDIRIIPLGKGNLRFQTLKI